MKVQEPHNVEAEQAFLGSILREPKTISRAARLVRPADFYIQRHSFIFQAMLDLDQVGSPLDLVTLADQLGSRLEEVGGFIYIQELEHGPLTAVQLDYYASIVRKHARLRRLIAGAGKIVRLAHRATRSLWVPDEALVLAESTLLALVKEERLSSVRRLSDLVQRYLERLQVGPETGLGLSTGLTALDDLCGRLQPADLVLVAGEPGTLKTSLVLKIARSAALSGRKVALFSLESTSDQVVQRLLVTETNLTPQQLRIGDIGQDWPDLLAAGERLAELDLYIDDTPGLHLSELRSKARWLDYLWSLDLIIVNYLQLLRPDQKLADRKQELGAISRALKALARELNLPLLAVSILDPVEGGQPALHQLNPVQYEADLIWLCEKAGDNLWLTQARWRDGPAGVIIELRYDPLKRDFI